MNADPSNLKEIVMLKRSILAAVVLASQALAAGAHAAQSGTYNRDPEGFYAGNPVADPAPTPAGFKQREIWKDPAVFYADNPVPAPADARRKDGGPVRSDPPVLIPGGREATGSSDGDAQFRLVNPY
jgi:hypothetical protein